MGDFYDKHGQYRGGYGIDGKIFDENNNPTGEYVDTKGNITGGGGYIQGKGRYDEKNTYQGEVEYDDDEEEY